MLFLHYKYSQLRMSLTLQNLVANPNSRFSFYLTNNTRFNSLKTYDFSLSLSRTDFSNLSTSHFRTIHSKSNSLYIHRWPVRAFESDGTQQKVDGVDNINLDAILSVAEFLCLASSAVVSIGLAVNKSVFARLGNRIFAWQLVLLLGAVVIGATIRSRQWSRVCNFSKAGGEQVNLVERIEKLEEDLRSSVTIIRVLSRQLEKLGIRFRVTRKSLKDPIAEAAALAQRNSEATRALAAQEDILEKELSEIQKVLLAMQEQQQKQLELILAIGKTGKLWDSKRGSSQDQEAIETNNSGTELPKKRATQVQAIGVQKEANNDRT